MRRSSPSPGFSLVEVLVTISVIALLLTLMVPALRAVRKKGRESAILAGTRQHVSVLTLYTHDFKDSHPWAGTPDADGRNFLPLPASSEVFPSYYFQLSSTWTLLLAGYYDGLWPHPSQRNPSGGRGAGYQYSCAMLADPAYWHPVSAGARRHLRATATHEVRYPDRKALLAGGIDVDPYPVWVRDGVILGFSEGSASFTPSSMLVEPLRRGDGPVPGVFHVRGFFGLDTRAGILGIDADRR